MSNSILNETTHAKIAVFLEAAYKGGFNSVGFMLPIKARELILECIKDIPNFDWEHFTRFIYQELYKLNSKGQAETYPHENIDTDFVPHFRYVYWNIQNDVVLHDDVQAYKSIQSFLYNSICDSPLIAAVKEINIALGNKIISKLDAYKKADFG